MIAVKNLFCRLNGRIILNDVTFSVDKGEYVVIVGANGVGKTTLLRCIDRIHNDWSGDIDLNQVSIRRLSRRNLSQRIALVQQLPQLFFSFNVRQYVEFGRYPHLKPLSPFSEKDKAIIDRSLKLFGIESFADRPLETLSGGERQKVYLATALVQEPEILLLDEPTTFLDYRHQSEISQILRQLNQEEGITIIEVSHDLNNAAVKGDHLIALSNGKVAFDGKPNDFMKKEILQTIYQTPIQLVEHPELNISMIVPSKH